MCFHCLVVPVPIVVDGVPVGLLGGRGALVVVVDNIVGWILSCLVILLSKWC